CDPRTPRSRAWSPRHPLLAFTPHTGLVVTAEQPPIHRGRPIRACLDRVLIDRQRPRSQPRFLRVDPRLFGPVALPVLPRVPPPQALRDQQLLAACPRHLLGVA